MGDKSLFLFSKAPIAEGELFPPVEYALEEPNGLLAMGGDLSTARLLEAYRQGIFPWYGEEHPDILWWSPNPRCVLFPDQLHISRSLRKTLRQHRFTVTMDRAFSDVINACAQPRKDGAGTWIDDHMIEAYTRLHREGYAHSVECWHEDRLVGGLYGVSLGYLFFGESMFSTESNASKVAFAHLVKHCQLADFPLIDCQITNPHLESLGATEIERSVFQSYLKTYQNPGAPNSPFRGPWTLNENITF